MPTEQATPCPSPIQSLYDAFDALRPPPAGDPDDLEGEEATTAKFCQQQDQFVAAIVRLRARSGRDILLKLDLMDREDYHGSLEAELLASIREDIRALIPDTGRA